VTFLLLFGRRFMMYLTIAIAIGAVIAALAALLTAQPVAGLADLSGHPLTAAGPDASGAPVELAFTGTDDWTLSLIGGALVVGGGFLLLTANKVDQRGR